MIFYVDIDETICWTPGSRQYSESIPIPECITRINRLYDQGHKVVYWTARGSGSGKSYRSLTEEQLREWGAKYHDLIFGKPIYDFLIDDKAIAMEQLDTLGDV